MKLIDIKNGKFNRLKVIELAHKNNQTVWRCLCDCGNITYAQGYAIRKGLTKSCGCLNDELRRGRTDKLNPFFKHGKSKTKEYHQEYDRKKLLKKYSLDLEDYEQLVKEQEGKCAICNEIYNDRKLFVDHDHRSSLVRGLLCNRCNLLLGWANDSIIILEQAIKYLSKKDETTKRIEIGHMTSRSLIALQGQIDLNNIFEVSTKLYEHFQKLVG